MSNFTSAHDFSIKNLVQAQNYHVHHQGNSPGRSPLELLRENIASGALHNSAERCDAPKCLPETRVAVQEEILSWITKGDEDREPKKILWLSGPAGSGKTAITGSVAEACKERGLLAASFFFSSFSGSANRRSKRCFVSTLAYQLIQHDLLQPMGDTVFSSIQRNPAIFDTRLSDQLESLVLSPLRTLGPRASAGPKVLIIDGLDECLPDPFDTTTWGVQQRKERDQHEILAVLLQAAMDPAFPFRILLASRPEPIIKNFFGTFSQKIHSQIFLDEKYEPDKDIALFLNSKFSEIRRRYGLPQSWPSDAVVNSLVENASGQFIYAATVIRFVDDSSDSPTKQLDRVLRLLQPVDKDTEPFGQLDALYRHILSSTPNPPLVVVWLLTIQKGIRGFQTRGQIVPAIFCRQFLQGTLGEGEHLLRNLGSLMYIPPSDDAASSHRLYHKTFMDFLEDPSRHCIPHVKSWWDFFRKRYVAILKDPSLPILEDEGELFQDRFLAIAESFSGAWDRDADSLWKIYDEEDCLDLQSCNAAYWAREFIESDSPSKVDVINAIFYSVHSSCPRWRRCLPACRHWRNGLILVCRNAGWHITGWLKRRVLQFDDISPQVRTYVFYPPSL